MQRSSGPCKIVNLPQLVRKQLNMCAIVAVMAILSALALTARSEAKIVYTPANVQVDKYSLDLNHDGITDFNLDLQVSLKRVEDCRSSDVSYTLSDLVAQQGNGVVPDGDAFVAALSRGAEIGPNQKFTTPQLMACVFQKWIFYMGRPCYLDKGENGPWLNVSDYLGLAFQIKGKTHYGWAQLSVQSSDGYDDVHMEATLTGYAYETVAGKSIKAGQTKGADGADEEDFGPGASLNNLIPSVERLAMFGTSAMEAPGLSIWRREGSVAATPEHD
jgi:hypothetical protein